MSPSPSASTLQDMFTGLAGKPGFEKILYKLVEHAPVGILLANVEHEVEFANLAAGRILGMADIRLDGKPLRDLFGDEYLKVTDRRTGQAELTTRAPIDERTPYWAKIQTQEDKDHFVKVEVLPVGQEAGGAFLCFLSDVSSLRDLQMDPHHRNTFFHNLIDSSVDGIIASDMKGRIIVFNSGAEQLLGYTKEEAFKKLHVANIYPEGEAREILKRMRSDEYGGKGKLLRHELIAITQDGRQVPMSLSGGIIYDRDVEIATFGIFTDLRAIQNLEQDLQQMHEMLLQSEKMAGLGRLAAGVAHEINNPMSGIMLYSNLILEQLGEDGPGAEEIKIIIHEAERCKQIVSDLLTFSHQTSYERTGVDLNEQIHQALVILEKQPLFHNIEIITELEYDLSRIWGNPIRLNQVFTNIIVNAAQAMEGKGQLTILTRHRSNRDLVEVCITDTGPGIDKKTLSQIFDPFFTTKTEDGGTGLGLSVSFAIVKEHRGTIRAESAPGEGTTFILRFPIYQQEALEEES
jgi:PAS domain S-box-containing protein